MKVFSDKKILLDSQNFPTHPPTPDILGEGEPPDIDSGAIELVLERHTENTDAAHDSCELFTAEVDPVHDRSQSVRHRLQTVVHRLSQSQHAIRDDHRSPHPPASGARPGGGRGRGMHRRREQEIVIDSRVGHCNRSSFAFILCNTKPPSRPLLLQSQVLAQ